jgi:hypothetical protein
VQQPPDTDLDCVRRKLDFDLFYVERMGPWLDARILLATVLYLARVPGKMIAWIFRFPGESLHTRQETGASAANLPTRSNVQPDFVEGRSGEDTPGSPTGDWYGLLGRIGFPKTQRPRNRGVGALLPPLGEVVVNGDPERPVRGKPVSLVVRPVPVEEPIEYLADSHRARPPPTGGRDRWLGLFRDLEARKQRDPESRWAGSLLSQFPRHLMKRGGTTGSVPGALPGSR